MTKVETIIEADKAEQADTLKAPSEGPVLKARIPGKRDIVRFGGERDTAIDLGRVSSMYIAGKTVTFEFYSKALPVEFLDEVSAKAAYEAILRIWAGEGDHG